MATASTRSRPRRQPRARADTAAALDDPGYRRAAREKGDAQQRAYVRGERAGRAQARAGRGRQFDAGDVRTGEHDDIAEGAGRDAFARERRVQRRGDVRKVAAPVTRRLPGAHDAAGFVLGLFAWALAINYLRGGPEGVARWLRAKFLNQLPADTQPASSAGSAAPAPIPNATPAAPAAPSSSRPGAPILRDRFGNVIV